jgi:hypothetical protein
MKFVKTLFGRRLTFDACQAAGFAVFLFVIAGYFLVYDRSPPFEYIGGSITCKDGTPNSPGCVSTGTSVIAQDGATVTRHRFTRWYRSDCEIEITGHFIDSATPPDVVATDRFFMTARPEWIDETKTTPREFHRDVDIDLPADAHGVKHYGELCYYSLDKARCNWLQKLLQPTPFDWPIPIRGPMMCLRVDPPAQQ